MIGNRTRTTSSFITSKQYVNAIITSGCLVQLIHLNYISYFLVKKIDLLGCWWSIVCLCCYIYIYISTLLGLKFMNELIDAFGFSSASYTSRWKTEIMKVRHPFCQLSRSMRLSQERCPLCIHQGRPKPSLMMDPFVKIKRYFGSSVACVTFIFELTSSIIHDTYHLLHLPLDSLFYVHFIPILELL